MWSINGFSSCKAVQTCKPSYIVKAAPQQVLAMTHEEFADKCHPEPPKVTSAVLHAEFSTLLDDYEQKSKPIESWKVKLDVANAEPSAVCGSRLMFGGKGKFSLCDEHNNWRTYIKLRRGK